MKRQHGPDDRPDLEPEVVEDLLSRIRSELTAEYLTRRFVLPYERARELYRPKTDLRDIFELDEELETFVEHTCIEVYLEPEARSSARWPRSEVSELAWRLNDEMGLYRSIMLERERTGVRGVLDQAARRMRDWAIQAHIDVGLMVPFGAMWPASRLLLAERYVEEFKTLVPWLAFTHPALLECRFAEVLWEHARLSLGKRR